MDQKPIQDSGSWASSEASSAADRSTTTLNHSPSRSPHNLPYVQSDHNPFAPSDTISASKNQVSARLGDLQAHPETQHTHGESQGLTHRLPNSSLYPRLPQLFADSSSWSFDSSNEQSIPTSTDTQQALSLPSINRTRPPSASSSHASMPPPVPGPNSLGKRRRENGSLDYDSPTLQRSKRPTPDPLVASSAPSMSRESSQSSFSLGGDIDENLIALLGSDPREDIRAFKQAQREAEEAVRHEKERRELRLQQEKEDEEMARRLQEELNNYEPVPPASHPPFSRLPSTQTQSLIDLSGRVRGPSTPSSMAHLEPSELNKAHPVNSEGGNLIPPPTRVKPDPSFRRLEESDDELEITDGANFTPNRKKPADRQSIGQLNHHLPWQQHTPNTTALVDLTRPNNDLSKFGQNGLNNMLPNTVPTLTYPGSRTSIPSNSSFKQAPLSSYHGSAGSSVYGSSMERFGPVASSISRGISSAVNGAYRLLDNDIASYGQAPSGYGMSSSFGNIPTLKTNMPWNQEFEGESWWDPDESGYNYNRTFEAENTEALKDLLNNIRPDEEENLGSDDRDGTPEGMADTANLYKYQQKGLAWLTKMEEGTSKGCILADDMGLGKTVQAIALMISRPSQNPRCKTTLIVAPVALCRQWEAEIASKVKPSHKMSVYLYHGPGKKGATWETLRRHDVVITTFATLALDLKKKQKVQEMQRTNPNYRPKPTDEPLLTGDRCKFYRCILDEAQNIKNKNAKGALAAYEVHAEYRLCMTGTPMMNSVVELYSLIHFLRIQPYCQWEKFNMDFARPLKNFNSYGRENAMRKVQALCKAIMLRRTKKSEMDGKPLVNLPERHTNTAPAQFDEDEQAFYNALETKSQLTFNKFLKAGTVGKNYSNILTLLLRLRQACCHPHLIKDFAISVDASPGELLDIARGLPGEVVDRIIENGIDDCPVCMDTAENYSIFHPCGHSTCPECFCRLADPIHNAYREADTSGKAPFKCHACRTIIEPKNVTDYVHFKKIHMPEKALAEVLGGPEEEEDSDSDSSSEDDDNDDDESADSDDSIMDFIASDSEPVKDEESDDDGDDLDDIKPAKLSQSSEKKAEGKPVKPTGRTKIKKRDSKAEVEDTDGADFEPGYKSGGNPFEKANGKRLEQLKSKSKGKGKGKGKDNGKRKDTKNPKPRRTLAQLKREGMRNAKARRAYFRRLAKDFIPSAKITEAMNILTRTMNAPEGEKIIVFSQFTSLLDLMEIPIMRENWKYRRFDGSMNAEARNDAVVDFTTNPQTRIMLVSLKAGNAGLNLTAASQVIILDPFWNPYIEEQAIDRAHRIGQRRTVQIHRILVAQTVEDRILQLQEKKRDLIEGALDEGASKNIGRLGVQELGFLFGVRT